VQGIAKSAINDCRQGPTPKPEAEIWRKPHKRTVPLSAGSWVLILHNIAWDEAHLRTKWYPDPSSRFARIDMGRGLSVNCESWGGGMYIDHDMTCMCVSVCLSLAAFQHYCTDPGVS